MPSHWGHTRAEHRLGLERDRHAGPARGRRGGSRRDLRAASTDIPDRESQFHGDEIVYTSLGEGSTSEGEFWEALNAACTRQLPVLFLVEDNGYAISVPVEVRDAGRRHLAARAVVPRAARRLGRRHRFLRQPARDARGGRLRPRAQGAGARPRARHPPVLALAVRRREAVQDAGGARSRSAARSDSRGLPSSSAATSWPPPRTSPTLTRRDRARDRRSGAGGAARPPKPAKEHRRAVRLLARRRSDLGRVRDAGRARGQARHDGRRHQPHAEGRDGAQPAHRRLRRGRRGREPARSAGGSVRAKAASSR